MKRIRLDFSSTSIKGSPTASANLCPQSGVGANRSQEMISKLNLNQALTTTLVLFTVPIVVSEDFLMSEVRKHITIHSEELPLFKPSIQFLFLIMDNFAQIPPKIFPKKVQIPPSLFHSIYGIFTLLESSSNMYITSSIIRICQG